MLYVALSMNNTLPSINRLVGLTENGRIIEDLPGEAFRLPRLINLSNLSSQIPKALRFDCLSFSKKNPSYLNERTQKYRNKPLRGQFVRNTDEIRDSNSWDCLRRGRLKGETERFLIRAAQEQALHTDSIK